MNQIILKDLYVQRYLLISGLILSLGIVFIPKTARIEFIIAPQILLTLLIVVLGVLLSESMEEKDYGYTFLSILPISHLGTIAAKFILLLLECLFFSLVFWAMMVVKDVAATLPTQTLGIVAISFAVNLSVGGLMLWGIYTFGLTNFTRGMLVLMVLAQVIVFAVSLESFSNKDISLQLLEAIRNILRSSPFLIGGIGLVFWAGLLILTAQFRKKI